MRLVRWLLSLRPTPSQLLISLLIAGLGWLSGQALSRVDQDLRIMYTEYTLGAADLAHISADVMRYRNTIIRALQAGADANIISASLAALHDSLEYAIWRLDARPEQSRRGGAVRRGRLAAGRRRVDAHSEGVARGREGATVRARPGPRRAPHIRRGHRGRHRAAGARLILLRPQEN